MTAPGTAPTGPWRVVVGVSGSIAAYKAPFVIRLLREAGHEVRTLATQAALRFIGAPALAAVTGRPVSSGIFEDPAAVEHVAVGEWADLVVVAPASADLLARVAAGRADDMLTATILTTTAPVVLAPAMHTQMWANPATRENVAVLRRRGLSVIDPDSGRLTGADAGAGRLPEPGRIVSEALAVLAGRQTAPGAGQETLRPDLSGRHVVVSAGGTREPIDPVRYLGNRSSGRQGVAIASAAARAGARVRLVAANIDASVQALVAPGVEVHCVGSAMQMRDATMELVGDADALVMTAAVADFRPEHTLGAKMKKDPGSTDAPSLSLIRNPDILAEISHGPHRPPLVIGFAAETGTDEEIMAFGADKAARKGADYIAVNRVGETTGFGDVPNEIRLLDATGTLVDRYVGSKDDVAAGLIARAAAFLDNLKR